MLATKPQRLFVVDAMAMAFRSYYALAAGKSLTNSAGQPTGAVYASAQFMLKLIADHRPDYLAIACDNSTPTFRHEMFPAYKANRSAMPEDLSKQMGDFLRLIAAFAPCLNIPGVEADDIIGTMARRFAGPKLDVYIVSGDKDFMQLVGPHVHLYKPKKGDEAEVIGPDGVLAKFGVKPEQVIDCLAIIGDTSDNVPGVHGIGDKGAAKLVSEYGSLEGIYESLDKIGNKRQREALVNDKDKVFLSRQLVTIKTDVDIGLDLDALKCDPEVAMANENLLGIFKQLEFKLLVPKVENAIARRQKGAQVAAGPTALAAGEDAFAGYELIDSDAKLTKLLKQVETAEVFAFDTETNGLDVVASRPIGASFSFEEGKAFYLPLHPKHLADGLTQEGVTARLKTSLERAKGLMVGHNIKFDLQMLTNIGITPTAPLRDTMIMDWLLDATGRQHGLDDCCLRVLDYVKIKTSTLIGEKGEIPMLDADLGAISRYACEDADLTLRLYHKLMPEIDAQELNEVLTTVEMPLIPVLARMEQRGVYVDVDDLMSFSERLAVMAKELEERIYKEAGETFNINSTKQLAELLFVKLKVHEALGVKNLKKTKSGYSTDESVLNKLAGHPLPKAIIEYRAVNKLKNTYVDTLPQLVKPETHRLHTSYHQTGTATGRMSSTDPNLQNIPIRRELGQEIRRAFKAESDDKVIVSADYSQIELRLLAHVAGEKELAKAFETGQDIHRSTAAKVFGVAPEAVDPVMRSRAKAINFGIIYGMGPRRLAQETGVSMKEAQEFIERYFASYPGIKGYIERSIAFARERGYSRTITGRRRPIIGMTAENQRDAVSAENIAVNSPLQGAAADLIKLAMIRVDAALTQKHLKARMLLQVHDELVFEAPRSELAEVTKVIEDSMRHAMSLSVPLDVQVGSGKNWLEAH